MKEIFVQYFDALEKKTQEMYDLASKAMSKGFDPEDGVEIAITKDLAARSEKLVATSMFPEIGSCGISERIRTLEEKYGKNDDRVALIIAREISQNEFYKFKSLNASVDAGIRVGLAYLTGGIVTAPLEGISDIEIKKNDDGSEFLSVGFAGPIRSAGGTASAMAALLSDYVRISVGLSPFVPRTEELERSAVEVEDYFTRVTKKQYTPTREETKFIVRNVPIELTGTPTELLEVS